MRTVPPTVKPATIADVEPGQEFRLDTGWVTAISRTGDGELTFRNRAGIEFTRMFNPGRRTSIRLVHAAA